MITDWSDKKFNEIWCIFKKNIVAILLSSFFIFMVFAIGNFISVFTSRQIIEPMLVKIDYINDFKLPAAKVLATLAHNGNTVALNPVTSNLNEWDNPAKTFVKKIIIGFKVENLEKILKVTVNIGSRSFVFNKEQFLGEWKKINTKDDLSLQNNLYDEDENFNYLVFEAPAKVKAYPMISPVLSDIFASINFGGSEKLIQKPLVISLKLFVLAEVLMFILLALLYVLFRKDILLNNGTVVNKSKKEFIVFSLSVLSTLFFLCIINLLVLYFYKPDISKILENAAKIYRISLLAAFLPKPVESAQFSLSVLISPFLLFISYSIISKKIDKISELIIFRAYYILSIVLPLLFFAISYIGLSASNFIYTAQSYSFNGLGMIIYSLLFFPIGACCVLFVKKKYNQQITNFFQYGFVGLAIFIIFAVHIISANNMQLAGDPYVMVHFNPVLYPMAQVVAGKTILVNLTSLYGLSAVFLEVIFKIVNFSVLSFTVVMGILVGCSYLFIYLFLRRVVKNKLVLFLGFLITVFYFFENGIVQNRYFSYSPIRIFFPCLVLLLVSFYFKNRIKKLYYSIYLLSVLAILWNLDSGFVVFVAWVSTLCFSELYNQNKKYAAKKIFFHLCVGALLFSIVCLLYVAYSFFRSGFVPNILMLWQYHQMFLSGFMLRPVLFPHVWILVVIIFLSGLLFSIKGWIVKDDRFEVISIFFLSVMGIGLFSYFQGRSHDVAFFSPLYIALILLIVLADIVFQESVINNRLFGGGIIFLIIFFFIFSSPINLIYNWHRYLTWTKSGLTSFLDTNQTLFTRNVGFINKYTKKGESIIILADNYEGLYYGESGTRSALDLPSSTDIFFGREVNYLARFLECNRKYMLFIYPIDNYYFYDNKINEIIKNNYVVLDKNEDGMALLIKNDNTTGMCSIK